jgi:hypothetical protein
MTDATNLIRIVQDTQPDEIYNLAAQSHVHVSFETPEYTANADGLGTLRLLEAIRILGMEKRAKFYQASTSELYGTVQEIPRRESTPFYPRSPYAAAKLYAYWITVNIERPMACMPQMEFCSTMRGRRGERLSSRGKLAVLSPRLNSVYRKRYFSAILMPSATGDMREIMSRVCGEFCSTLSRMITSRYWPDAFGA